MVSSGLSTGPGRPSKIIAPDILHEAFHPSRSITISQLAKSLGVSRPTLYKNMALNNISRHFSPIETVTLNDQIKSFKSDHPSSGYRFVQSELRSAGHRVQRWRILEGIRGTDSLGVQQRTTKPIARRIYTSPRPNYLWHQDGHHKLGPWGVVIHGIIDGYDRVVSLFPTSIVVSELIGR